MPYSRYTVECANSNYGGANVAIMDITTVQDSVIPAVAVAQIVAFAAYCGMGAASSVVRVLKRNQGAAGSTPLPWDQTAYDALRAVDAGLPALTGYAQEIGATAIGPLGVGMTLSLYSVTPGRKTTGRIYTPFVRASYIGGDGVITSTARTNLIDGWSAYILDNGTNAACVTLDPVVHSDITNTNASLVTPVVSALPSRLKTRTR